MKGQYKDKKISITRTIEYYCKSKIYFDLITYEDIKK